MKLDLDEIVDKLNKEGQITVNEIEEMLPPGTPIYLILAHLQDMGAEVDNPPTQIDGIVFANWLDAKIVKINFGKSKFCDRAFGYMNE